MNQNPHLILYINRKNYSCGIRKYLRQQQNKSFNKKRSATEELQFQALRYITEPQ